MAADAIRWRVIHPFARMAAAHILLEGACVRGSILIVVTG